jgi:hypothetical protein
MFAVTEQPIQRTFAGGDRSVKATRRNSHDDATAVVALLAGDRAIDPLSKKRAVSQLLGLSRDLTLKIVERHAKIAPDRPVDEVLAEILGDLENEGVLGPVS